MAKKEAKHRLRKLQLLLAAGWYRLTTHVWKKECASLDFKLGASCICHEWRPADKDEVRVSPEAYKPNPNHLYLHVGEAEESC